MEGGGKWVWTHSTVTGRGGCCRNAERGYSTGLSIAIHVISCEHVGDVGIDRGLACVVGMFLAEPAGAFSRESQEQEVASGRDRELARLGRWSGIVGLVVCSGRVRSVSASCSSAAAAGAVAATGLDSLITVSFAAVVI